MNDSPIPQRYVLVLIPGICECNLICKKKVSAHVIKLRIPRWDHPQLSGCDLNPVITVQRHTGRGVDGHMKTEAGWEWCSNKSRDASSHQKLDEARNGISPRVSVRNSAMPTPWFQTSDLQNCEKINFCFLKFVVIC